MPDKSQPPKMQAGAADKKPNRITKKRLGALLVVGVVVVVVVAVLFMQVGGFLTPGTQNQTAPESGGSNASTMDMNAMYESEIENYLAIIEQHPDDREARLHIAQTYHLWAQSIASGSMQSYRVVEELYSDSIDYYVAALKLDDTDIESIGRLGYVYFDWAEYMLNMTDADLDEYYLLYVNSIDCFTQAIEGNGEGIVSEEEISNMTVNKAIALFTLNQVDEAIGVLESRIAVQGSHFQLCYNLGILYEAKGNTVTALSYYEQARTIAEATGDANHASAAEARIQALQAG